MTNGSHTVHTNNVISEILTLLYPLYVDRVTESAYAGSAT